MEYSRIRNRFDRRSMRRMVRFVKDHVRHFSAGVLFVLLVLMLANCTEPGRGGGENSIVSEDEFEEFEVDAHEDVNTLINQYYTAYAAGDIAMLQTLASPISANEQSYISVFSQYVDGWQNIHCYTKSGLEDNSYLVSVTMEIKLTGVDTLAPGLDFFYVHTNNAGVLYIDNLYCSYNENNDEIPVDPDVQALIEKFELGVDVIELQNEVQGRYNEALLSDPMLVVMVQTTIQDAIDRWALTVTQNVQQDAQQDAVQDDGQGAAEQDTQQDAAGQDTQAETPDSETNTDTPEENTDGGTEKTEQLATNDRVNVRAAADTNSERLGILDAGTVVTRIRVEGDWSVIQFNNGTGYVRNDFLTYDLSSAGNTQPADNGSSSDNNNNNGGDVISFAEGTVIELKDTVNVREGMSETSDKVGTAYAGETVTVIMSYADGWTRVRWNGKTGYIKSDLLQ